MYGFVALALPLFFPGNGLPGANLVLAVWEVSTAADRQVKVSSHLGVVGMSRLVALHAAKQRLEWVCFYCLQIGQPI